MFQTLAPWLNSEFCGLLGYYSARQSPFFPLKFVMPRGQRIAVARLAVSNVARWETLMERDPTARNEGN